jgi:hypothetical protein
MAIEGRQPIIVGVGIFVGLVTIGEESDTGGREGLWACMHGVWSMVDGWAICTNEIQYSSQDR